MLDRLRITARPYDIIRESEQGHKTPGYVEIVVEALRQDAEAWEVVLREEGPPDAVRALAEAFALLAAQLKRVATEAERNRETVRVVADEVEREW